MTDPLRELLREGRRLCSDAPDDVEAWVKWCREVETALAQEPDLCIHGQHPADGCEKCAALAQQPEPVAECVNVGDDLGTLAFVWADGFERVEGMKLYAAPPSAAALIAEKDAEIERLKTDADMRNSFAAKTLVSSAAKTNEIEDLTKRAEAAERALAQIKEAKPVAWQLDEDASKLLRDTMGVEEDVPPIKLSLGWLNDDEKLNQPEYGLRVHLTEYPEEGAIMLLPCTAPQPPAGKSMEQPPPYLGEKQIHEMWLKALNDYGPLAKGYGPTMDHIQAFACALENVVRASFGSDAIPREIHDRLVREAKAQALVVAAQWFEHRGQYQITDVQAAIELRRMASEHERGG